MTQVDTREVTLKKVLWSSPFNVGFNEAKNGLPLNYDRYNTINDQWAYERGRQFAFLYDGSIKYGKQVRLNALYNASQYFNTNIMI